MDFLELLLAEQSPFAELHVAKITPNYKGPQVDTVKLLGYEKDRPDATQLTDVDTSAYSITNLPNTVQYIPENSIFKYILTVREEDPDFRFVQISSTEVESQLTGPSRLSRISKSNAEVYPLKIQTVRKNLISTEEDAIQTIRNPDNNGIAENAQNEQQNARQYVVQNGQQDQEMRT